MAKSKNSYISRRDVRRFKKSPIIPGPHWNKTLKDAEAILIKYGVIKPK